MTELQFIQKEKEVLQFWKEKRIFEKSLEQRKNNQPFVFYEGPPTANGQPGIHHVLARSFKDLICRYQTMKGLFVERKAGWDTHGLPVELEVEKELGFKSKTDIEQYGIKEFNAKAKASVWKYKTDWEQLTERMGYWIDLQHPYITFETEYIETLWWLLKQIDKKGLLYKNYKVLPYCPRCGTPLSSHEVALGYQTVSDPSIYIKFPLLNPQSSILQHFQNSGFSIYLLVWTTTPWTLPANVAIAVDANLNYKLWQLDKEILVSYLQPPKIETQLVGEIKGEELIGEHYQPLYPVILDKEQEGKKLYEVVGANFVSTEEGTGLVHIAPAFGEDDMNLSKTAHLAFIKHVDEKGNFLIDPEGLSGVKGLFFKEADPLIFEDLKQKGFLLFGDLKGTSHEYPFCWRCHTPLLYYAFEAWYIKTSQLKEELLKNNEKIYWVPDYIKDGRFGQWLKENKDWAISRNRYWGTPLNVWECNQCGHYEVIGSLKELKEKSLNHQLPLNDNQEIDLHRPFVDEIEISCPHCQGRMKRRKEVLDCWFDSGSMPYAQYHFPFAQTSDIENMSLEETIKKIPFPADFICEAVDQTRGWFYTLLAISTLLGLGPSYKHVISLGLVLDAKGEKMSKSRGNVVKPMEIIEKYGVDSLRWYLYTLNRPGEEKRFSEQDLVISQRRFFNTIWNVLAFYQMYAFKGEGELNQLPLNQLATLNQWILADLEQTKVKVRNYLDQYLVYEAAKELDRFVDDLSRWYLRRSRRVFQKVSEETKWKESSLVLRKVLKELTLLLAPFCPFFTETLWQELQLQNEKESVHLADYPQPDEKYFNENLLLTMEELREIANQVLSLRQKEGIKVRQPLQTLKMKNETIIQNKELIEILKDEVNVKNIIVDPHLDNEFQLDTQITEELKEEGIIRELIRQIQEERKLHNFNPKEAVKIILVVEKEEIKALLQRWYSYLQKETLAQQIEIQISQEINQEAKSLEEEKIIIKLEKI